MIRTVGLTLAILAAAGLLGATDGAAGHLQNPHLHASVGPALEISFRDAQGNRVTKLDPGTYEIEVRDLSEEHSFHLEGPGVNERTAVEATGIVSWTVTFRDGTYEFHCDPHPSLGGRFIVGNPPTQQPPAQPPAVTPRTRLVCRRRSSR